MCVLAYEASRKSSWHVRWQSTTSPGALDQQNYGDIVFKLKFNFKTRTTKVSIQIVSHTHSSPSSISICSWIMLDCQQSSNPWLNHGWEKNCWDLGVDIFKYILSYIFVLRILIKISLKVAPNGPINNMAELSHKLVWCPTGDKQWRSR